jgi:hypothetical protein
MFGCLILSRYSPVRRAAEGAPISGLTLIGISSQKPAGREPARDQQKASKKT